MDTAKRTMRRRRIRARVHGTAARPRVSVFRGSRTMTIQLIDDESGKTVLAANAGLGGKGTKIERAQKVGKELAEAAKKQGITQVVFDRGGYQYHGRVKALAEALREGGLTL